MVKRKVTIFLFLAVSIWFIKGCTHSSSYQSDGWVPVTDMLGRKVLVPGKVNRVIGLRAGALRLLVYMDATDMIAGVEQNEKQGRTPYTIAHPELKLLPSVGPSMGGDAELIVKQKPDVIFITYTTAEDADAMQKKTGIPVIALECPEFGKATDTLFEAFKLIGKILNKKERADTLIAYIRNSLAELNQRTSVTPDTEKPLVYIGGVPYSGAHGIISTQPYYPPFMFVNALNAASGIDQRLISHVKGTYIDIEQLIQWNPDILFIDESGLAIVKQDLAGAKVLYSGLKAIQHDNVYTLLPYNNYATNYEMVLANAWFTGKILYPGQFQDIHTETKTDEIFKMFVGKEIFGELKPSSMAFRRIKKDEF